MQYHQIAISAFEITRDLTSYSIRW